MPARWLARNHGTSTPGNLLFFDTETDRAEGAGPPKWESHSLRLWCATALRRDGSRVGRRQEAQGSDPASFWDFLVSRLDKRRPLWVWGHNIGFDLTQAHFWKLLEDRTFTAGPLPRPDNPATGKPRRPWRGVLCLEGRPTFAVVRHAKGTVRFVDTGNYWPHSLQRMGETFGLPKLAMPSWTAPDADWFAYCRRDVDVTERAVLALLERWQAEDCGVFKMTAAGLALANFQHSWKKRTKGGKALPLLCEPNEPHHALEREGYFGGRVEPFFTGTMRGPIHHLDVCSLYLNVMAHQSFPVERKPKLRASGPAELLELMGGYGAVARVRLNARHQTYPVRVHRMQLHCRGCFDTVLCGPELERALRAGDVESIGEHHLYKLDRPFKDWAAAWWERKREATARGEAGLPDLDFAKLVGNALQGKFAQRGRKWREAVDTCCVVPWGTWFDLDAATGVVRRFRGIGGHPQELVEGEEPDHSFPLISAYVAAYGREFLRDLMRQCPANSVLYTATDSLLVTQGGFDALKAAGAVGDESLGLLNVKGTYDECEVRGSNWYRLGGKWTMAGFHGKRSEHPGEKKRVKIWQQLPSVVRSRPDGTIRVVEIELLPQEATPKGVIGADGWHEPYRLSRDDDFGDKPRKPRRFL